MEWYSGNIPSAVAHAQSQNSIFCVVIFGQDPDSATLQTSLISAPVQELIKSNNFVCIQLSSGSPEHLQFQQIYTDARAPCIYCITIGGVPVEIISQALSSEDLKIAFERAVQRHKETIGLLSVGPAAPKPHVQAAAAPVMSSNPPVPVPSTSSNSSEPEPQESTSPKPTLEERIERAKKLAAAKQAQKEAEEAEEAKRREFERREAGRHLAERKRLKDEEEAKKLVEERRKDKREEAELRRRVKEQFAQDRAKLAKKAAGTSEPEISAPTPASSKIQTQTNPQTYANYTSGAARIQFRLPDGSTHNHSFEPESKLGIIRAYVKDNLLKSGDFNLSVAFPRRQFTPAEYDSNLKELGLLPSAALLVIPIASTSTSIVNFAGGSGQMLYGFLVAVLRVVISPIAMIYTMFSGMFAGAGGSGNRTGTTTGTGTNPRNPVVGRGNVLGGNNSPGGAGGGAGRTRPTDSGSASGNNPSSGSASGSSGSGTGAGASGANKKDMFGKQEGNIRRLKTDDSDDENATWNGNSTQQM